MEPLSEGLLSDQQSTLGSPMSAWQAGEWMSLRWPSTNVRRDLGGDRPQPPTSLQGYLSQVLDFLSECPSGIKLHLSTAVTGLWGSFLLVSFPLHFTSHPPPCFLLSSPHKGAAFSFSSQIHLPGKPKAIARVSHITVCAFSYQAEDGDFIIVIIIVIIIITISSERSTHAK